jgi:hypothetical protein
MTRGEGFMRRLIDWTGLVLVTVLAVAVPLAYAVDVPLDQVPKPIMDTVKARFADIKVVSAGKEKAEDGNLIYEITLDDKGMNIDATLSPEGKLVLIEKQITRKDLPEKVAKALESKFPKSRYRKVEAVFNVKDEEETLGYYEVLLITPQKLIRGVELAADGKILKVEKKTSEEEED